MSHDVVLKGFRLNAGETPAKVLERVLGLDAAKARKATQRFPVILARTSQERAERIAAALADAGALVELHESEPAPAAAPAPEPLPPGRPSGSARALAALPPPAAQASLQVGAHALAHAPTLIQRPASEPYDAAASPALAASEPANDWTFEAPAGAATSQDELELDAPASESRATPMTAYQLGELSLDLGQRPDGNAQPAAPKAPEAKAPAPKPVPKPAAADSSGGGMQSFGDGFDDDVDHAAPALELDTDARWRHGQKPAPEPERQPRAAARASGEAAAPATDSSRPSAARRSQVQPRYVAPAPRTGVQRLGDRLLDAVHTTKALLAQGLALGVVTAVTVLAVAYARSPDALFELTDLGAPPAVPQQLQIAFVRPVALPSLVGSPRIHPLLRLVPDQLAVEVAQRLRDGLDGVVRVPVNWPASDGLRARDVECALIEHPANDPQKLAFNRRLHALLRTGHPIAIPPEVEAVLRKRLKGLERQGANKSFTELCLAL